MRTSGGACSQQANFWAQAAALGMVLALTSLPVGAQLGGRGALPDASGAAGRSNSADAARSQTPSTCSDCGVVQAIERRDRRARWSSIVGTPAAQSPLPDTVRSTPPGAGSSASAADAGADRAGGPSTGGREQTSPGSGRSSEPPVSWVPGRAAPAAAPGRNALAASRNQPPSQDQPAASSARSQPAAPAGQDESTRSTMPAAVGETRSREQPGSLHRAGGWRVLLRMDDGTARSIDVDAQPELQVGDRVRLKGSQIYLR